MTKSVQSKVSKELVFWERTFTSWRDSSSLAQAQKRRHHRPTSGRSYFLGFPPSAPAAMGLSLGQALTSSPVIPVVAPVPVIVPVQRSRFPRSHEKVKSVGLASAQRRGSWPLAVGNRCLCGPQQDSGPSFLYVWWSDVVCF